MADDTRRTRDYEELKKKLGLQRPKKDEAPLPFPESTPDVGEPPGERTPAAGFDLGLERPGEGLDVTKPAEEAEVPAAVPDVTVRRSRGQRIVLGVVLLVAIAAAFGLGYAVQGTRYDRIIARQQRENARDILKRVRTARTLRSGEPLWSTIETHIEHVRKVAKKAREAAAAEKVTDAMLEKLADDLERLHEACKKYAEAGAYIDAELVLGRSVFNGEAVKALLAYAGAVKKLYDLSAQMALENRVFEEFRAAFDPSKIRPPSVVRAWQWATGKDKKVPIEVPPGHRLPPGAPTHRWQILVTYQHPERVGIEKDKATQFVDTDVVVEWDLRDDIAGPLKKLLEQHHRGYKMLLLRRLLDRVEGLKKAADEVERARGVFERRMEKAAGESAG